MLNAVLWNLNARDHGDLVERLIQSADARVVVVPECRRDMAPPLGFRRLTNSYSSLAMFSSDVDARVVSEDPTGRCASVLLPSQNVLVVGCHLVSKRHNSTVDQLTAAGRLHRFIEAAEVVVGHDRTIVLGDMNMDPYELGMVHCEGLHAVMSRVIASRVSRIVQAENRRFFYNPMWGQYGDDGPRAPATYYYGSPKTEAYYWHMFDQILVRPSLIGSLKGVRIVEAIQDVLLIDHKQQPLSEFSDHLPVVVELSVDGPTAN